MKSQLVEYCSPIIIIIIIWVINDSWGISLVGVFVESEEKIQIQSKVPLLTSIIDPHNQNARGFIYGGFSGEVTHQKKGIIQSSYEYIKKFDI
jgi:hypothetical protein